MQKKTRNNFRAFFIYDKGVNTDYINKLIIGILTIDNIVETNIVPEASSALQPYFSAKIAVVLPAGMAVKRVDIPISIGSKFKAFNMKRTITGITMSLKKE